MIKKRLMFLLVPCLLFFAMTASADKKEERIWEDEIIYSLMIDRFNNADTSNDYEINALDPLKFHGGDFQGVIQKLDYLKEMGFTAVLLSPVFSNEDNGYHGEWVNDFYKTEEHFGTLDELKKLIKEAHHRDMKVMTEFIVTHVGPNHPWTNDPSKKEWFDEEAQSGKGDKLHGLPALNLENEEVQNYLIDAAKWWIQETEIDGYSISNIDYAPVEFWEQFIPEVKAENDRFLLTGTISAPDEQLSQYEQLGFTGLFDHQLNGPLRAAFADVNISSKGVFDVWDGHISSLNSPERMIAYFDDKDVERFTRDMVNNSQFPGARWKMALTYLYTQPEVPMVYYGSEIAVNGGLPPDNHPSMDFRADKTLIDFIKKLGKVRQEQPALSRGTMELLHEKDGLTVFKREYEDETIVVVINNSTEDRAFEIPAAELQDHKELRGLIGTDMVRSKDGKYSMVVDREMSEIYKLYDQSKINFPFIFAIVAIFGVFIVFMYIVWRRGRNIEPS